MTHKNENNGKRTKMPVNIKRFVAELMRRRQAERIAEGDANQGDDATEEDDEEA